MKLSRSILCTGLALGLAMPALAGASRSRTGASEAAAPTARPAVESALRVDADAGRISDAEVRQVHAAVGVMAADVVRSIGRSKAAGRAPVAIDQLVERVLDAHLGDRSITPADRRAGRVTPLLDRMDKKTRTSLAASVRDEALRLGATKAEAPSAIGTNPNPVSASVRPAEPAEVLGCGANDVAQHSGSCPTSLSGVSCNAGGTSAGNAYYRAIDLASVGITSSYSVCEVRVGIEIANTGSPITVRLWSAAPGTFPTGFAHGTGGPGYTLQGTATHTVPAGTTNCTVIVPITATIPAGSQMIIEWNDGVGGTVLFPGANTSAQTGPSYISSPACGLATPASFASVGFPTTSLILSTSGTAASGGGVTVTECDCGAAGSDCCFANGGTGCDDPACEAAVCAQDSFCCDVEWDGICADTANDICAVCGGGGPSGCPPGATGDCCVANGTPGCDDPACCDAVCAIDAFCCDTSWDSLCAGQAGDICPACQLPPPANDECVNATDIGTGSGTFPFDQTGATTSGEAATCVGIDDDVWFTWTASCDGSVVFATCGGAPNDTAIAAYLGCGGTQVACNDDSCGLQSSATFPIAEGTTYLLRVGTFAPNQGATGSFQLLETCLPEGNEELEAKLDSIEMKLDTLPCDVFNLLAPRLPGAPGSASSEPSPCP